jgi:adenylate cyclase
MIALRSAGVNLSFPDISGPHAAALPHKPTSAARPTTDLTAYDLYLRALAVFFPMTKERVLEALGLLEQATAIDRHYGPALALAAMCHLRLVVNGWAAELETTRRKATDLARQALEVGQSDPASSPTPPRCLLCLARIPAP